MPELLPGISGGLPPERAAACACSSDVSLLKTAESLEALLLHAQRLKTVRTASSSAVIFRNCFIIKTFLSLDALIMREVP
jgi:hypothetical protein